ncbi:MAG: sigma-70 family RNA polymerase sigma factor [Acidobacteriota bacterium]
MTETFATGTGSSSITELLAAWADGDSDALDALTPLVYDELRVLAHGAMRGENAGHLLQTTALIHEAYLRLVGLGMEVTGRVHFFAIAARLMRRILVDFARAQRTDKRGGRQPHLELDEALLPSRNRPEDIIRLDDALQALESFDARKSRVIELRYFAGLTIDETAEALGMSHATVERDLKAAKAWLIRELDAE